MEPQSSAPAVVAVVVTCDPGPWFDEALSSLASQDYPNLSVLVVDAGSRNDPAGRVAAHIPGAFLRRIDHRVGFGIAANEVIGAVEGASHYLFCHDDVAFEPSAVRLMVEEAFRSNAGIISPKLVEWDRPDRLLAVGEGADKVGVAHPLVEPGERDQEQHDAVRDVFIAPGGATLVRADLFTTLGGFREDVAQFGEDLDISWRAHVAGARVLVAPAARVRHREAVRHGERSGWMGPNARNRATSQREAHRVRTVLACYGWLRLCWILPLALFYLLGEAVTRLIQGRPGEALAVVRAAGQGLSHPGLLLAARHKTQRLRQSSDGDIRRLQSKGNARLRAFLRSRLEDDGTSGLPLPALDDDRDEEDMFVKPPAGSVTPRRRFRRPEDAPSAPRVGGGTWRLALGAGLIVVILFTIGSRSLFAGDIPAIGQIPATSGGLGSWWHDWWTTWRPQGLGQIGAGPPGMGMLAFAASIFFGALGVLTHVLVLGPLLLGPLGAYRATRWWASRRGQVVALIVYATVPVPYNALARGHWPGLLAYGAAPWLLGMVIRLSADLPFPSTTVRQLAGRVVGIGILVAFVAAFAPSFMYVVPAVGVALFVGSSLVGRAVSGLRTLGVSIGATIVALLLLEPWGFAVLGHRSETFGVDPGNAARLGLGQILRFHTGPVGGAPLGWALLAAAALPLVIGRSWRLAWAGRFWMVALAMFGWAWSASRGWVPGPQPEVLLSFAAAALAGSASLGAVAFDLDLPGYQFGWRQMVTGVALVAGVIAAIPMLIHTGGGRWNLPESDASSVMAFLPNNAQGDYRVLWVGAPGALPLASSYLEPGFGYATSYDGEPDASDQWNSSQNGGSSLLAADMVQARQRMTTQLGHLLAPLAVRYIVIPNHNAPAGSGAQQLPVPADILTGLQLQTDLQLINVDPNYTVYVNAAWAPARAVLSPAAIAVANQSGLAAAKGLESTDLSQAKPVLSGTDPDRGSGQVPGGSTVYVSAGRSGDWQLRVNGQAATSSAAFGWAQKFAVPAGASGKATLKTTGGGAERIGQIIELVLWILAIIVVSIDLQRRRKGLLGEETVRSEWFAVADRRRARRSRPSGRGVIGSGEDEMDSDEVWIDA